MITALLFLAGLVLLIIGGELLVRGASSLATAFGISPMVVGLTVVALGTSAPELAVSIRASLAGQGDLAVGNAVGSNIFNVLFILGISALVRPLIVSARMIRMDVPLMIVAAGLTWALCAKGHLTRLDGVILLAGIVAYTTFLILHSRRETRAFAREVIEQIQSKSITDEKSAASPTPAAARKASIPLQLLFIAIGLGALLFGAQFLVDSAVTVAKALGVSELVIGLTIVSVGTSLPEVAASVIATFKGQRDLAIGNVLGSNIFNCLCILGAAAVAHPINVPASVLGFDLPIMFVVCLACLPIFFRGRMIARWEGLLFLSMYFAYTLYLIMDAAHSSTLPTYSRVMLWFVLPLLTATILALAFKDYRATRRTHRSADLLATTTP